MPDQDEARAAERLDRMVEEVLAGGRLRITPSDASEYEAVLATAGLAGAREPYPRMSLVFKRRLEGLMQGRPEAPTMSRRAALVAGLGVAIGGLTGAVAERVARPVGVPQTAAKAVQASSGLGEDLPSAIEPLPSTQKWWDTGIMAEDLLENVPVRVSAGSVGAFIVRRGNTIVGVSAYCTHLPCELEWLPNRTVLNCPCHNAAFNLNGESLGVQYKWPTLPAVNVRVTNGAVEVLGTG